MYYKNCNHLKKTNFVISIFCAISRLRYVLTALSIVNSVIMRELNFGNISSVCAKEY